MVRRDPASCGGWRWGRRLADSEAAGGASLLRLTTASLSISPADQKEAEGLSVNENKMQEQIQRTIKHKTIFKHR
jgi:hypothetical protein